MSGLGCKQWRCRLLAAHACRTCGQCKQPLTPMSLCAAVCLKLRRLRCTKRVLAQSCCAVRLYMSERCVRECSVARVCLLRVTLSSTWSRCVCCVCNGLLVQPVDRRWGLAEEQCPDTGWVFGSFRHTHIAIFVPVLHSAFD